MMNGMVGEMSKVIYTCDLKVGRAADAGMRGTKPNLCIRRVVCLYVKIFY